MKIFHRFIEETYAQEKAFEEIVPDVALGVLMGTSERTDGSSTLVNGSSTSDESSNFSDFSSSVEPELFRRFSQPLAPAGFITALSVVQRLTLPLLPVALWQPVEV